MTESIFEVGARSRGELLDLVMERVKGDTVFVGRLASFDLRPEQCAVWYRKQGYEDIPLQDCTEPRVSILYNDDKGKPELFIKPEFIFQKERGA